MTDDPVSRLVAMAPTPAVLVAAPAPGEAGGATASNDSIDLPADLQEFPVVGTFSNAVDAELDGTAQAIFTIRSVDMPALVRADFSRCKVSGVDYSIDKIRKRYWMGVVNGYTFALVL